MKVYRNKDDYMKYTCEFTEVCDKYFLSKKRWNRTYLYCVEDELREGFDQYVAGMKIGTRPYIYIPFRSPGATRGCLCLDKNHIIRDIKFYEEECFTKFNTYARKVIEATKKFIGEKLEVEVKDDR